MRFSNKPALPTTLEGLDDWGANWLKQMGPAGVNFAAFGLTLAPNGFDALYASFHDLRVANLPPFRTPAGTQNVKEAKQALLDYVLPIKNQISALPEGEATALVNVATTGVAGQFSCNATTLLVGMAIEVSGTLTGTGTIAGYADPTTYVISATNGTTTFTLQVPPATPIVTTAGTMTGLAFMPLSAPGICSRGQKIELRVNPQFNKRNVAGVNVVARTEIKVTAAVIEFSMKPVDNLKLKFRYSYQGAPLRTARSKIKSSARPEGCAAVEFYYKLIPSAPGRDPYEGMVPMFSATKSPTVYTCAGPLGGRQIYVACRPKSQRGVLGDWSAIHSTTVTIEGVNIVNAPG